MLLPHARMQCYSQLDDLVFNRDLWPGVLFRINLGISGAVNDLKNWRKMRCNCRIIMDMNHEHKFETFEHTADIGVIGRGSTMAEAFESTAYGMFAIVADLKKYPATETREVEAIGDDSINLLERFLSSLIVIFEADHMLPVDFKMKEFDLGHLKCEVAVHPIGDDIEWIGPSVKAVTYHQMDVDKDGGQWFARAIFDV